MLRVPQKSIYRRQPARDVASPPSSLLSPERRAPDLRSSDRELSTVSERTFGSPSASAARFGEVSSSSSSSSKTIGNSRVSSWARTGSGWLQFGSGQNE